MKRGRGLKPSRPERSAHRLGGAQHPLIAAKLTAGLRGSADLSHFLPAVFDQGGTETCFAHSLAAGLFGGFASAGKALPFVPSPKAIASLTYASMRARATPVGATLPVLFDGGAELQDVADTVAKWGVCPIGQLVDGRNSDAPDDQEPSFPEPDLAELQAGAQRLVGGEYQIAIDGNAPATIAAALDAGIYVWVGGLVGPAYEQLAANDVADPTPASDAQAGGHAQLVCGYRTSGAGLEFLVRNSWGGLWAAGGSGWVSSAWVDALWAAWPLAVAS